MASFQVLLRDEHCYYALNLVVSEAEIKTRIGVGVGLENTQTPWCQGKRSHPGLQSSQLRPAPTGRLCHSSLSKQVRIQSLLQALLSEVGLWEPQGRQRCSPGSREQLQHKTAQPGSVTPPYSIKTQTQPRQLSAYLRKCNADVSKRIEGATWVTLILALSPQG